MVIQEEEGSRGKNNVTEDMVMLDCRCRGRSSICNDSLEFWGFELIVFRNVLVLY